jgi:hypothetical protein
MIPARPCGLHIQRISMSRAKAGIRATSDSVGPEPI